MGVDATHLINLDRYAIDVASSGHRHLVDQVRRSLANDGCAVLREFLTPKGVCAVRDEADRVAHLGHQSFSRTNPYFTQDDSTLPASDPRRRFFSRSNSFVPADHFSPAGALRTIQNYPGFDPFIQSCVQQPAFFRYADPLADVIVNVAYAGNGFPWHFDTNNFTVTLAIQNAEFGGEFEYAPNVRRDSENFDEVTRVLDGQSSLTRTLVLEPGDLQLFRGRYSLHRVAPLSGSIPRYVAIYSYVDQPDMVASPERCKQLYGRVLPIHFERAGQRADPYLD